MLPIELTPATVIFVITVATSLLGLFSAPAVIENSLFRPYWFLRRGEYHTVITSGLVHADLSHLLMNMVTFYFFAFQLEAFIGMMNFAVLYVFGLLASSAYTWYRHSRNPNYATLGASGAIAAVLFAFIVYAPTSSIFILPFPFPIPAVLFAFAYLAYTYWAAKQQQGRINHDAHLWGALSGLLFVAITDPGAWTRVFSMLG